MRTNIPKGSDEVAQVQTLLRVDMDPTKPVQDLLSAIQAMVRMNPTMELEIMEDLHNALEQRLNQLKGDEVSGESIRKPSRF